jgi:CHAT domain-containing protein
MQRIISSYIPTLAALARARSRSPPAQATILAIGITRVPDMPALSPLPCTDAEIEAISKSAIAHQVPVCEIRDGRATVEKVVSGLKTFNCVHLACHAHQDELVTIESKLYLADAPLPLSRIASLHLTEAEFAFLSACCSAGGSAILPDEAMHIAAGMQMAGYRTVVATMWTMLDVVGPTVAREFYTHLLQGSNVDGSGVASALRQAILVLRKDKSIPAAAWVNYICMGI